MSNTKKKIIGGAVGGLAVAGAAVGAAVGVSAHNHKKQKDKVKVPVKSTVGTLATDGTASVIKDRVSPTAINQETPEIQKIPSQPVYNVPGDELRKDHNMAVPTKMEQAVPQRVPHTIKQEVPIAYPSLKKQEVPIAYPSLKKQEVPIAYPSLKKMETPAPQLTPEQPEYNVPGDDMKIKMVEPEQGVPDQSIVQPGYRAPNPGMTPEVGQAPSSVEQEIPSVHQAPELKK